MSLYPLCGQADVSLWTPLCGQADVSLQTVLYPTVRTVFPSEDLKWHTHENVERGERIRVGKCSQNETHGTCNKHLNNVKLHTRSGNNTWVRRRITQVKA